MGKEIIKTPLIQAWCPTAFKALGPNLLLIEFEHSWDKSRILEGHPWMFDGHLISRAKFDRVMPPTQLEFEKAAFWVWIFNLPLGCMGKERAMYWSNRW
jgi:hypothetical protein